MGVTTLGLVGETLKGPAFEPIFITNFDEFQTFFGGTVPTKFINTQIPKYESAYIAKAYLQQSNQLFVTRILGLSGYDAGPSWNIQAIANVAGCSVGINTTASTVSFSATFTGNTSGTTVGFTSALPALISNNLNTQYSLIDGSTSNYSNDLFQFILSISANTSVSASTVNVYGSIPNSTYTTLNTTYPLFDNVFGVDNVNVDFADLTSGSNDPWYYATFDVTSGNVYTGYSWYNTVTNFVTGASGFFSGTLTGQLFTYSGTAYSDWNNLILATIRSRGISIYDANDHGPQYQVTGLTDLQLVCDGAYSGISSSPFATFQLSGVTFEGKTFAFDASFDSTSANYITKVLGITNFSKPRQDVPIFVEESYLGLLNYGYNKGYVRGVKCDMIALPEARDKSSTTSIAWNLEQYQTPKTPWLVAELRGNQDY